MQQQSSPLLTTKLFVVRPQSNLIPRERLAATAGEIGRRRLTLVSAPAGFGKTTFLSEWIERSGFPAAWISLDRGDNDLIRFMQYMIAALRTIHPGVGENLEQALKMSPLPPVDMLLTSLINDIATVPHDFLLVLDDYHVITNGQIHEGLIFLLDHASAQMHIAITTRVDPPVPISRFRVRGALLEVRANDLRFSPGESAEFFRNTAGLDLSERQLQALCEKTEGWVAGLQMAGLSLEGRQDIDSFITAFTGADRYVLDYLLEEVLNRQPEDVQRMLLDLSVLDRFNGPLCEGVTGSQEGGSMLEKLERGNLFLVSLDNRREWYRYHHLFADLLHHRLRQQRPESIPELHRRASLWFEREGLLSDALLHATSAKDFPLIARLLEENMVLAATGVHKGDTEVLFHVSHLPPALVEASPRLAMLNAWHLVYPDRDFDEVERLIGIAEQTPVEGVAGVELAMQAACLRAIMGRDRGDFVTAVEQGELARRLLGELEADHGNSSWSILQGLMYQILGASYSFAGNTKKAIDMSHEALRIDRAKGNRYSLLISLGNLGRQCTIQGYLNEATACYQEMMALDCTSDPFTGVGPSIPYLIQGRIEYERGNYDSARQAALEAIRLCVADGSGVNLMVDLYRLLALINDAANDMEGAIKAVEAIERIPMPEVERRLETVPPTLRAQLALHEGNIAAATEWEERFFGPHSNELPERTYFLYKAENILRARLRIARGEYAEGLSLLEELREEFERRDIPRLLIEVLVLMAVAHQGAGESEAALASLAQGLRLGAPEGYIRPFAYEGAPVTRLLSNFQKGRAMASLKLPGEYLRKVMDACGLGLPGEVAGSAEEASPQYLYDDIVPLTAREIEILKFMAQGYSNQKIADKLYVSINTIKTHASNLVDKLGARNRVDALVRARDAKIL
jgi:LuxR family maltose regulon positive regulatory protein